MITKLEAYAIALLVVVLAAVGCYFYGRHDGRVAEQAKWEKAAEAAKDADMAALVGAVNKSAEIGQKTLTAVSNIRVIHQTINKGIEHEIQTNTVYRNDCFPDSGRLLWNAANRGVVPDSPAVTKPIDGLPARTGTADSGQQGRNAAGKSR